MIILRNWVYLVSLGLTLASCSDGNDDKAAPAPIAPKYGVLKTSLLAATEVRLTDITTRTCTSDPVSGLFTGTFGGAGGEGLVVNIKDFDSSAAKTYTCVQSESNRDGDLGTRYTGCSVEFTIPNPVNGLDTYSMTRTEATQDTLTYGDACTVASIINAGKVTLSVSCKNLIQSKYKGQPRVPITPTEVATAVEGTAVECTP